jgi:hypothetical protein
VILWNDFVLDTGIGPLLLIEGSEACKDRGERLGSPGVMEDARTSIIQETGQEIRPARMVGYSFSESHPVGMEADRGDRANPIAQREGE